MNLSLQKDYRNTGKYYHKTPRNTACTVTRKQVCKEISDYTKQNQDFGIRNYIHIEYDIVTKLNPYTTYVYEDLY